MKPLPQFVLTVVIFLVVWGVYSKFWHHPRRPGTPALAPIVEPASSPFHCDGRNYCSQMTSCAEAKYFLKYCSDVKMDGDHDGVPCEDQWCPNG